MREVGAEPPPGPAIWSFLSYHGPVKPSRRRFLKATAATALLVEIPAITLAADAPAPAGPAPSPLRWVRMAPDGSVTVLSNTSEIGQGTGTAIAQILADELDLEWKRIRLEMAPVEKDYFNATWGEYATYGSGGIAGQYEALRTAGAQARARLVAAAAARWKVPAAECDTSLGTVVLPPPQKSRRIPAMFCAAAPQTK
jgi:isoquinoline 1-oxidoreductase beta subunit